MGVLMNLGICIDGSILKWILHCHMFSEISGRDLTFPIETLFTCNSSCSAINYLDEVIAQEESGLQ